MEVSHSADAIEVTVKVRRWAAMDSASRVPTQVGVHFDTRGDRKPDHLVRIDGFHYVARSTRGWNQLRPNGMDPYGDLLRCFPAGLEQAVDPGVARRRTSSSSILTKISTG